MIQSPENEFDLQLRSQLRGYCTLPTKEESRKEHDVLYQPSTLVSSENERKAS